MVNAAAVAAELTDAAKSVATVVGILVGIAGLYAFLWAAGKVQGTEKALGLLSQSLDAVNATLERERTERELERAADKRHSEEQDRACAVRIAELEGRVELLRSGFVERVGVAIAAAVRDELRKPQTPGEPS